MTDENITVSGGILLVRSESGRSKLEKVLVETKPGQTKSRVKCRLQRFVNETMAPFLIRNNKKDIISKAVHFSLTNIHRNSLPMDGDGDFEVPRIHEKYAKDTEVPNLQMIYSQGSIHFLQQDLRRVEIISSSKKLDSEIALSRTQQMEYKDPHTQETVPSSKKLDSELDEALLRTEQMESKAVSSSKKLDSELDGTLPTKEHKEVKEEDCEKIENDASLPNLFKIDSETNTLYENETKNHESTIHIPYSDDDDDFEADDDEFSVEPITKFRKYNQLGEDPAKVKAQYHKPHEGGEHSEPEDEDGDDDDDEDYDTDDEDEDYDIDVDDQSRYIDSGLRRLKSDEDRLFVLPVIYKTKRRPPSYDDDIKPVLGEIPSDVFHEPEDTTKSEDVIIPQSSYEKVPTDVSTDDDVSKTPSEDSDIDTKPLERLKELEDTTFTISTGGLVPADVPSETRGVVVPGKIPGKVKDKGDIRVRAKEPSDDLIPGKIPGKVVKDKDDIRVRAKESSDDFIPGKIPGKVVKDKDDIRIHTKEPSDDLIPGKIPGKVVKDKVDIRVRTKETSDDLISGKIPGKVVKSKIDIRVRTKEPSDDLISGKIPGTVVKDKVDIRVRTKEPSDDLIPGRIPGKVVKDKINIRVRTKEASDDLIFSSSDIKPRKKKKRSSIFRFFRKKDDFCVHTVDPSGSDYSTTALDKKIQKDICVHTIDPSGKSDYSSTTVDESKTIENTRIRSNVSSRDVFDQKRKEPTNKLSNRNNVASPIVFMESGKTMVKPLQRLPERGNFASETVFNKKREETSLQSARRNNPYSATYLNDSIQKSEASKRKLSGRSYFASTSMFDQKRENSLNKLPTRTNLRSTNDVYDDSIRNRDDSLNKLQKRGRSSSHTLQPKNRSGSSSKGSSQHSRNISTVSLIDNKEARRSKYSKMKMRRSSKDL